MGQEFLFAKPGSIGTVNPDLPGLRYVVEDYFSFSSSEIYLVIFCQRICRFVVLSQFIIKTHP